MKRSKKAVLVTMASICVVACEPVEPVRTFQDVKQCELYYAASVCQSHYHMAKQANLNAPKFEDKKDCDTEFGKCETRPGGSEYYPVMNGFVSPSAHNSNITAQPLYGNSKTMDGTKVSDGMKMGKSQLTSPKSSTVVSRGGFGARGASISSGGG